MNLAKDYYKELGVSKNASEDELKSAYRRLAKMYHHDLNPGNKDAEAKLKEINEAYRVLSNPKKREQYDMGTYDTSNPTNQVNSNAYNIFNALFKDDIEKFNLKREDYIKFLDEMEPKFNQYGRTLKDEKSNVQKLNWSIFIFDNFDNKKTQIRNELSELERNAKAFDEYIQFLDEMEPKFKQYNRTLKQVKEELNGKKGSISADEISKSMTNYRKRLAELERNAKAFDEYIQFLDEMEPKFNQFNIDLKQVKEELNGKRGSISADEISKSMTNYRKRLAELERNVKAFDEYIQFLDEMEPKFKQYNRTLKQVKEELNGKRGSISADEISKSMTNYRKRLVELERNAKAFDEYIQFLDEMEPKFNQFNIDLKEVKEKLKGKRGSISADEISKSMTNYRERLSELERNAKAFDEYIQFLDEMEPKFNQYNRTLKPVKEELNGKRGSISAAEISESEMNYIRRLSEFEVNSIFNASNKKK